MEQFGRFIKNTDESVKAIQDRGQVHCEKCQGCKLHELLLSGIVDSTLYLCVVLSDSTIQQLTKDSSQPRLCFCWHMGFSVLYFTRSKKRSL